MALEAKWNDDLDLSRVIQTPKVGLGPFISQPEIPLESFNPMGYPVPGVPGYSEEEEYNETLTKRYLPRLCQRRENDKDIYRPKLRNPLPLPHPVDIVALIHNRDHPSGGGVAQFIDLDSLSYEIVRRALIELPTPFGLGKDFPSSYSEDENDPEEDDSTIRKSLTSREKEEEGSATSSYQASAEDTPLVLRSASYKQHERAIITSDVRTRNHSNMLDVGDALDKEKQKKLSTIASESDVGLNTEDAISEAADNAHINDNQRLTKDVSSLNGYAEEGDEDGDMASLTKSLEELDRDVIDGSPASEEIPSNRKFSYPLNSNHNVELKQSPLFTKKSLENVLGLEKKCNGENSEQTVRHAIKERDKRDAELVSAAVFSSLRKNSDGGSGNNFANIPSYRSPRKQRYVSTESSRIYYNHNLNFPPIGNSGLGVDSESGQDSDPALTSTPPTRHFKDQSMNELSSQDEQLRPKTSYDSKYFTAMGRRSTSTTGVDEPPLFPIRRPYHRSSSHTRSAKLPVSSDLLLNSSFGKLSHGGKSDYKSADILKSKDDIDRNPESYSTVV